MIASKISPKVLLRINLCLAAFAILLTMASWLMLRRANGQLVQAHHEIERVNAATDRIIRGYPCLAAAPSPPASLAVKVLDSGGANLTVTSTTLPVK